MDFYTTHLGMQVSRRGRLDQATCRALWRLDEEVNAVVLARGDQPKSLRVRMIPVFDLPDRPDFDIRQCGPLGLLFGTADIARLHGRLSQAGVEFHNSPVVVGPGGFKGRRFGRSMSFGRAYDGEYLILAQPTQGPLVDGTVSPYFGVTEPLEISFVVPELEPASRFLRRALGFHSMRVTRRAGEARERAMGLPAGTSFNLEILQAQGGSCRVALIHFEPTRPARPLRPPHRGLNSLRFECRHLDAALKACALQGASPLADATEVRDVDGRAALAAALAVDSLGILVELWQPLGTTPTARPPTLTL